ncbi:FAD binding domain of DNA photolyase-domain-containing protein [Chytriomyces sp. MP71]|nr:FAD binding domain of DNA photolyase-domain-containing protein [Chytriomyces sp. MP71]
MSEVRVLYWFRTDLRLHDSPALAAALGLKPSALFPVWCWDPNYVYKHRVGVHRWRFLLESMRVLSSQISATNPLSQLLVVRGEPTALLPVLWKQWRISHIVFEKDPSAYGRRRDTILRALALEHGVKLFCVQGHHLYDPEEVVKRNKGKPTMTITNLQNIVKGIGPVPKPIDAPATLPHPALDVKAVPKTREALLRQLSSALEGTAVFDGNCIEGAATVDLNSSALGGERDAHVTCYETVDGGSSGLFSVPTLESIGMDRGKEAPTIQGGEVVALARLAAICAKPAYVATFSKPQSSPAQAADNPSTTLTSPYLKFGCLSVRRMWWDIEDAKEKHKGAKTAPPENLNGQLLFRDMYACAEFAIGDAFSGIRGNAQCRYMDWHLPTHYDSAGKAVVPRPLGDPVSEARLAAFKAGRTGFPWIDAQMRQLRAEGWMHHLGRHSVAAFLTRGQCWISWERGAEIFDELLIDWDPCANPGNWMWLSCSAFYAQYWKLYGCVTFPQKYDKTGALVRKYVPELARFPDKYIYEPHLAPLKIQKEAGCIIGTDYPSPMLDEKTCKEENMKRMKVCFEVGLYGSSKEVLDGTANHIIKEKHGIVDPPKELMVGKDAKKGVIENWLKRKKPEGEKEGAAGGIEPRSKVKK